jgi:hypothetical protein
VENVSLEAELMNIDALFPEMDAVLAEVSEEQEKLILATVLHVSKKE